MQKVDQRPAVKTIKTAMAREDHDLVHFSTGEVGDKTLCGLLTDSESWQELANHEVEDAFPNWCGNCRGTNAWIATFPPGASDDQPSPPKGDQ